MVVAAIVILAVGLFLRRDMLAAMNLVGTWAFPGYSALTLDPAKCPLKITPPQQVGNQERRGKSSDARRACWCVSSPCSSAMGRQCARGEITGLEVQLVLLIITSSSRSLSISPIWRGGGRRRSCTTILRAKGLVSHHRKH